MPIYPFLQLLDLSSHLVLSLWEEGRSDHEQKEKLQSCVSPKSWGFSGVHFKKENVWEVKVIAFHFKTFYQHKLCLMYYLYSIILNRHKNIRDCALFLY